MSPRFATLLEALSARAAEHGDREAYVFLDDDRDAAPTALSYAELARRVQRVAARIATVMSPGDRALLLYPTGVEYLEAFLGCLAAGVIAVPAYPPSNPAVRASSRLRDLAADCGARFALTTEALVPLAAASADLAELSWLATDGEGPLADSAFGDRWRTPGGIDGDSVAFLQYTSGSTSAPRGVVVTHNNLVSNTAGVAERLAIDASSTVLTWVPPYHDLGLIGGLLQGLAVGARSVSMSPTAFIREPTRWLRAVSRYGATHSGGPNFGFELCLRKTSEAERDTLDLSRWRCAFNGAEPVRARHAGPLRRVLRTRGILR